MIRRKDCRANILTENIIFIILNLAFLLILVLFIFTKVGGVAVLEERYAKEIALLIDSAEDGMTIQIKMEDALETANKEGRNLDKVIVIEENIVTVQLRDKGGYSYSFFNDVHVDVNQDIPNEGYYFVISKNE